MRLIPKCCEYSLVFINAYVQYLTYFVQVVWTARRVRRNDTTVPQLPLLILAITGSSLYRGSRSSVPGKVGGCRSGISSCADSSANLLKILLAVKDFAALYKRQKARGVCVCMKEMEPVTQLRMTVTKRQWIYTRIYACGRENNRATFENITSHLERERL